MTSMDRVSLQDLRIAVLISDGFEEIELTHPAEDLRERGALVEVLAHTTEQMRKGIQGMNGLRMTQKVQPDVLLQDVMPERYQGLLLPGGVMSVDRMRLSRLHIGFVQSLMALERPIGTMGHAAWLLADATVAQSRTLTSALSIQKDLERAGAIWKDQTVVVDGNLITSRGPQDLIAFSQKWMEVLSRTYGRIPRAA